MAAQTIHALLAGKTDRADRQAEFSSDFRIRTRGRFKEKQFDQAAALRRKRRDGITQELFLLRLLHEFFRNRRRFWIGKIGVGVAADEALLLALPAKAMVMRDLHQPFRKGFGFAQIRQSMKQFDAGGLKHFGSFVWWELVFNGNRVDERFVFVDESGPSLFISSQTFFDQALVGPLNQRIRSVFGEEGRHSA